AVGVRARGGAAGCRPRVPAGLRLVLSLLLRPRPLSRPGNDGNRAPPLGGRGGGRPHLRRAPDALPLGPPRSPYRDDVESDGDPVSPSGRSGGGGASLCRPPRAGRAGGPFPRR